MNNAPTTTSKATARPTNGEAEKPPVSELKLDSTPINVARLCDEVLALLADDVPREIGERKARREAEFVARVREQAELLGLTPPRLAAALAGKSTPKPRANGTDGRSTVAPKYRNPADPAQVWSGRGAAPPWIEFSNETLPPRKPGGEPRKVPLAKFRIPEGAL
jgi:DNA-binding protein H-NS